MLLSEIKKDLGILELKLETALDANNQETDWLRHWQNDKRFAISIHKELAMELCADPDIELELDSEIRTGAKGSYTAYRIVKRRTYTMIL